MQLNLKKLIDKFKNFNYKKRIVKNLEKCYFINILPENINMDSNNLECMKNCVIETCFGKKYPRRYRPDDFITKEYYEDYDFN
jgi:hypothetical protein